MRIAIVGAHGVGKTTLGQYIAKTLECSEKIVFNTNIARSLIAKGYPLNKDATTESYIQYIIAQLSAEQSAEFCDFFVSDRTLLDPLAYATVNDKYERSLVPKSIIDMLLHIWLLEQKQYDFYVLVPIEFPMPKDNIRPQDEHYRKMIEEQMIMYLQKYNINYVCVRGTIEERYAAVSAAISKYQQKTNE